MIKNALIKTTPATAIDCTHIEQVTGIAIDSSEPNNTQTRYLISVDNGKWRKFTNGVWDFATEQDLTADSVLAEGNTKAELIALNETNLSAFAGKVIDVAVAISVENNAEIPTLEKFEIVGQNLQIKKDIIFSDVIKLSDNTVGITGVDVAKTESSGGAVNVFASVLNDANEWTDYVEYEKTPNKGKAIRFKAEVEADRPGISTAVLSNIKVHHWQDAKSAAVEGKSVLITKPYTLSGSLSRAHAIIRHPDVRDTEFDMYINLGVTSEFLPMTQIATYERNGEIEEEFEFITPKDTETAAISVKIDIIQNTGAVSNAVLGTGTSKQQVFKLEHHARPETIQIVGSNDWTFKENTDTLLVTAKTGDEIYISYDWLAKTTYLTALACIFNS